MTYSLLQLAREVDWCKFCLHIMFSLQGTRTLMSLRWMCFWYTHCRPWNFSTRKINTIILRTKFPVMCYTVLHLTASLQILTPSLLIYKVWPLSLVPMLVCDPWEMVGGQFGVISECVIWVWRRCSIFVLQIVTVYAPTNHADSSWEANAASETFCSRQLA